MKDRIKPSLHQAFKSMWMHCSIVKVMALLQCNVINRDVTSGHNLAPMSPRALNIKQHLCSMTLTDSAGFMFSLFSMLLGPRVHWTSLWLNSRRGETEWMNLQHQLNNWRLGKCCLLSSALTNSTVALLRCNDGNTMILINNIEETSHFTVKCS